MRKVSFSVCVWQWYPDSENPDGGTYELDNILTTENFSEALAFFKKAKITNDQPEWKLVADLTTEEESVCLWLAIKDGGLFNGETSEPIRYKDIKNPFE